MTERRMGSSGFRFALIVVLLAGAACSARGASYGGGDEAFSTRETLVQPGDQIRLEIWRETDMSGAFTVDDQGEVVLPRIGTLDVSEMSSSGLQSTLRGRYAEYLRDAPINVQVLRRIGVHGEVRRPDLYMVDMTVTLRDVVAQAGGVTENGNPNDIVIVRGEEQIRLRRDDAARFATAQLRSGDQVVVGRRNLFERQPLAVISTASTVMMVLFTIIR